MIFVMVHVSKYQILVFSFYIFLQKLYLEKISRAHTEKIVFFVQ